MKQPMVRGYMMKQMATFLETYYDEKTRQRLVAMVPPEVMESALAAKPADWYPGDHMNHIFRAIVAAKNDEKGVYDDLVACGRIIATEATNTFLRILMKIMTPPIFVKKIPDFWARDFNTGKWEVDASKADAGLIKMTLSGVEAYEHVTASAAGFLTFGLNAVGKPNAKIKVHGWSLTNPNPSEARYEVSWQ